MAIRGRPAQEFCAYNIHMNAAENAKPAPTNNPLIALAVTTLATFAEQANSFKPIAEFGEGNVSALIEAERPNHPKYSEVTSLQDQIAALLESIDNDLADTVKVPTPEEITEAQGKLAEVRTQAEAILPMLKQFGGESWLDNVPDIFRPKAKSRNSSPATDQKRPRLAKIVITNLVDNSPVWEGSGDNADATARATFTNAARVISKDSGTKLEVTTLQDHAFTVAGTKDLTTVKDKFEFGVTSGDKHYNVVVTPKV